MIPTALSIDEIASRLGGEVVSSNMVRAPSVGCAGDDRSLSVLKAGSGVIVMPPVGDGGIRERHENVAAATAHVNERLSQQYDIHEYRTAVTHDCLK